MPLSIEKYSVNWEKKWDTFINDSSFNGTFLQTRQFLSYHPEGRFIDASLLVMQGSNIVAVIPACEVMENGKRCFFSHKGSTFGGIIIDKRKYSISTLEELFPLLEGYLISEKYECAYIKNTSDVFTQNSSDLLDYYFYKNDYSTINELSFYIDCNQVEEDIPKTWSSGRRRDYRYSLKNNLTFRKLTTNEELSAFYDILSENLARHRTKPVHTIDELKEFRDTWLPDTVGFYGVFYEGKLIAGTMLFYFGRKVFHTQYLAQNADFANLFTMNYLIYNLIKLAKESGYEKFSFGISTEERGKVLNTGLAVFKEGFGTQFCNNRSYFKNLSISGGVTT